MQVNGSGKAAEAHLNWLAVVARDEVDTSWDLVERVARELFERHTLNAAEIAARISHEGVAGVLRSRTG